MSLSSERKSARDSVLFELEREVEMRQEKVAMHPKGTVGDAYRRALVRFWKVALKAVKEAAP